MSDSELSPFLLSIKKTEVRYSLLAPFPWTAIEYPNVNSRFPDTVYFGHDITELATAMADVHKYEGDDRRAYIARLVKVGLESQKEWDREPPLPPSGPLPDAYIAATLARMRADVTRTEIGKGESVSMEDVLNSFRYPPLVKKTWWSNWTPVPWDNIFLSLTVAVVIVLSAVLLHTVFTQ